MFDVFQSPFEPCRLRFDYSFSRMSKVCFAVLLASAASSIRAQELGPAAEHAAAPSIEITAAAPQPTVASPPDPTPAPPAAPIRLSIAAAKSSDGKAETSFRSNAPQIVVRWRGENLPVGCVVRVAWIAEDVGDVVDRNFVVDQDETGVPSPTFSARFTISRPSDGWAAGKYRVDLFVDDVLRDTLGITIGE